MTEKITNGNALQIRSVLNELLDKEGAIEKAVQTLMDCLGAVRYSWDGMAKEMVESADYSTRARAAEIILNYREGKPVERKEVVFASIDSLDQMKEKMRQSPELRRQLAKELKKLTGGDAIDVNTIPDSVKSEDASS